jgi:hypothetical protein
MRHKRINLAAVVSLSMGMVCLSHLRADDPEENQDVPEIVKEAEMAFKCTQAEHQFQQRSVEDLYQWSRRLMEAERASGTNKNAALDHVTRMRQLHEKIEALFKHGVKGGSETDFHATRYYLLEAQAEAVKPAK